MNQKSKVFSKFMSFILSVTMLCSTLSTTAWATSEAQDDKDAEAHNDTTISDMQDIPEESKISAFAATAGTSEWGTSIPYKNGSGFIITQMTKGDVIRYGSAIGPETNAAYHDTEGNMFYHWTYRTIPVSASKNPNSYVDFNNVVSYVDSNGFTKQADLRIYCWAVGTEGAVCVDEPNELSPNMIQFGHKQTMSREKTGDNRDPGLIYMELHFYPSNALKNSASPSGELSGSGFTSLNDIDNNEGYKIVQGGDVLYTTEDTKLEYITSGEFAGFYNGTEVHNGDVQDNVQDWASLMVAYTTSPSQPFTLAYNMYKSKFMTFYGESRKLTYQIVGELPEGKTRADVTPIGKNLAFYTKTKDESLFNHVDVPGYKFIGWKLNSDGKSGPDYTGVDAMDSDVTVYGSYEPMVGNINITKKIEDSTGTKEDLGNFKFNLSGTSDAGAEISITKETNDNGVASFTNVPVGTYTLDEVQSNDGEEAGSDGFPVWWDKVRMPMQVTINENENPSIEVTNINKTGKVEITKTISGSNASGKSLAGFAFKLTGTSADGTSLTLYEVTDSSGKASFTDLPISGDTPYTVTEIKASEVPNSDPCKIRATQDLSDYIVPAAQTTPVTYGNTAKLTFSNVIKNTDPVLEIEKTQSLNGGSFTKNEITVSAGDTITYKLKITNNASAGGPATNVIASDSVPSGLTLVAGSISNGGTNNSGIISWNLGDITVGGSKEVTFDVSVPSVTSDKTYKNAGNVSASNKPDPSTPIRSNEVIANQYIPGISVEKMQAVNGGAATKNDLTAKPGDIITYSIIAKNSSNSHTNISNLKIEDTIPDGLTYVDGSISNSGTVNGNKLSWNIASITPGSNVTVTFQAKIPDNLTESKTYKNVSTYDPGTLPPGETNEVETSVPIPKLSIEKKQAVNSGAATKDKLQVDPSDTITYTVTVSNDASSETAAENVVITDDIPAGLTLVSGSISNDGQESGGKISWSIPSIAIGASATVSFKAKVPDSITGKAVYKNDAEFTSAHSQKDETGAPKPIKSNEVVAESASVNLEIEKEQAVNGGDQTKSEVSVDAGDIITYTLTVKNGANAGLDAEDVTIEDAIPNGTTLVEGSISDGGSVSSGKVLWNLGKLAIGGTKSVTFQVKVPDDAANQTYANIGNTTCSNKTDPDTTIPSNEVKATVGGPNLTTEKEQAVNNGERTKNKLEVVPGDTVTYYIKVANPKQDGKSNGAAKNVVVTDKIPSGLELVEGSISDGGTVSNNEVKWSIDILGVNKDKTMSFKVKVPDTKEAKTYENFGTVKEVNPNSPDDPNAPSIDTNKVVIEEPVPVVTVIKKQAVNNGTLTTEEITVKPGDTITYSIEATNSEQSKVDVKDFTITDSIPKNLSLVAGSISNNGQEDNGDITWNFDKIEIGKTVTVTFKVTVPSVTNETTYKNFAQYTEGPYAETDGEGNKIPKNTNEVVAIEPVPVLKIEKTQAANGGAATKEKIKVISDDEITYYVTVINDGSSKIAATDVVVTDQVPDNLALVSNSISDDGSETSGTITWNIREIGIGESKTLSFKVKVPQVKGKATYKNIAQFTSPYSSKDESGNPTFTPSNEVVAEVLDPVLEVVKSQARNDGDFVESDLGVNAGDTVTYSLKVSNTNEAGADAIGVTIKDPVPNGLDIVEGSISDEGSEKDGTITWSIDNIKIGESKTVTFKVKVPDTAENTTYENLSTVTSTNKPHPDELIESNKVKIIVGGPNVVIEKAQSINDGEQTKEELIAVPGDTVKYYLKVTNPEIAGESNGAANDLIVTDVIPNKMQLVEGSISNDGTESDGVITWNIKTLPVNGSVELTFEVVVPNTSTGETYKNIGEIKDIDPEDPDNPDTPVLQSNEVIVEEPVPEMIVEKYQSVNGEQDTKDPVNVKPSDILTYKIAITNSPDSKVDMTDFNVTDEIPKGLTLVNENDERLTDGIIHESFNRIAPGETVYVTFDVRVPKVSEAAVYENTGMYTSGPYSVVDEDGDPVPQSTNTVVANEPIPEVELIKTQAVNDGEATSDPVRVVAGDVITYYLTLKNKEESPFQTSEITITDTVPEGLAIVEGSISDGGSEADGVISWTVGKLEIGESAVVSFQVKVPDDVIGSAKYTNYGLYNSDYNPVDENGEQVWFESNTVEANLTEPILNIVKTQARNDGEATASDIGANAGDTITYTLTVSNEVDAGSNARDLTITDNIPKGLILVEDSISDDGEESDGTITWNIDKVEIGKSKSVSFKAKIPDSAENVSYENVGIVKCANLSDPDEEISSNEVIVAVDGPMVITEKYQQVNDEDRTKDEVTVMPGDKLKYYIVVSNPEQDKESSGAANNLIVTDAIPKDLILDESSISDDGSYQDGVVTWNIETIPVDGIVELTFEAEVPKTDTEKSYSNAAKIMYEDPEIPGLNTNEVVADEPVPDLSISKEQSVNDGKATKDQISVSNGDIVTYYVTISNSSTSRCSAKDVVVNDVIPDGLKLIDGSISDKGNSDGDVIVWNVEKLAAGKSKTFTFKTKVPDIEKGTKVYENVAQYTSPFSKTDENDKPIPTTSNKVVLNQSIPAHKNTPTKQTIPTKAAKTGDNSNIARLIAVISTAAVIAVGGVIYLVSSRKKRE